MRWEQEYTEVELFEKTQALMKMGDDLLMEMIELLEKGESFEVMMMGRALDISQGSYQ